jgi:hypothetical protein
MPKGGATVNTMVAFLQAYWFELLAVATVIAMPIVTIYTLIDD